MAGDGAAAAAGKLAGRKWLVANDIENVGAVEVLTAAPLGHPSRVEALRPGLQVGKDRSTDFVTICDAKSIILMAAHCRSWRVILGRFLSLLPVLFISVAAARGDDSISPEAVAYIDAALNVMRQHYLHRDKTDWTKLKQETFYQAAGAQTAVDTYPAIRFALARLEDHHSYLQPTPDLLREENSRRPKLANPSAMPQSSARKTTFPFPSPFRTRRVPEGAMVLGSPTLIAQIVVPLFSSQEHNDIDDFATKVQNVIAQLASKNPCGWIIDLRGNGGGNLWAMLAGVGPILGEGEPGASLQEDGTKGHWYYENGKAGWRNDPKDPYYARTNGAPIHLAAMAPVAML